MCVQGAEPAEFWALLGGQVRQAWRPVLDEVLAGGVPDLQDCERRPGRVRLPSRRMQQLATRPRLFHVTNKRRGFVDVEEVTQFSQVSCLVALVVSHSALASCRMTCSATM